MITKLLSSKFFFFLLVTIVILGLNITPLILQYRHSPAGRTFGLIHNNVQDYYFYQSLMNEGANGAWLTSDPYTSEPHQTSIIFSYFLWLGKLSKLLNLSYALTYHLSRIILGFFFLLSTFYFLLSIRIPYPRLTYLFFLFAAPSMHIINDYGTLRSVPYMAWWNGVDPIRRAAFLPHHMLGGFLLIISIILIFQYINYDRNINQKNKAKPLTNTADRHFLSKIIYGKNFVLLILLSAIMAFVHTPSLLILLIVIPSSLLIYYLVNILNWESAKPKIPILKTVLNASIDRSILGGDTAWQVQRNLKGAGVSEKFGIEAASVGLLIYWVTGLLMLLFMILQTKTGFPWSQYIDWERKLQFPLDRELIGALGILLPFSIIGVFTALKSKNFEKIFIASWLIVPLLFIPIAPKFNLSNIRLIQGVPYLPLAILAVLGIKTIETFIITSILKTGDASAGSPKRAAANTWSEHALGLASGRTRELILLVIISIFIIFTLPTLQWSLKDQIREFMPIYGNVYLDNRLFKAFEFINLNFPPKTITLATFYSSNFLPAYTNTVSFVGHFGYTYNVEKKEKDTGEFFDGKMTDEEAKNFLLSNKIALIFQGPEEKPLYKNYLYPALLKPVYDREEVTLYRLL